MDEGSNDVDMRVAVGDHHALRLCRSSARVIDDKQIGFGDIRLNEVR